MKKVISGKLLFHQRLYRSKLTRCTSVETIIEHTVKIKYSLRQITQKCTNNRSKSRNSDGSKSESPGANVTIPILFPFQQFNYSSQTGDKLKILCSDIPITFFQRQVYWNNIWLSPQPQRQPQDKNWMSIKKPFHSSHSRMFLHKQSHCGALPEASAREQQQQQPTTFYVSM